MKLQLFTLLIVAAAAAILNLVSAAKSSTSNCVGGNCSNLPGISCPYDYVYNPSLGRCVPNVRRFTGCNKYCVKGTFRRVCIPTTQSGTQQYNPSHPQPSPPYQPSPTPPSGGQQCFDICVCNKGWFGTYCDEKKIQLTFHKELDPLCGAGFKCKKQIRVKCECDKDTHHYPYPYNPFPYQQYPYQQYPYQQYPYQPYPYYGTYGESNTSGESDNWWDSFGTKDTKKKKGKHGGGGMHMNMPMGAPEMQNFQNEHQQHQQHHHQHHQQEQHRS